MYVDMSMDGVMDSQMYGTFLSEHVCMYRRICMGVHVYRLYKKMNTYVPEGKLMVLLGWVSKKFFF